MSVTTCWMKTYGVVYLLDGYGMPLSQLARTTSKEAMRAAERLMSGECERELRSGQQDLARVV